MMIGQLAEIIPVATESTLNCKIDELFKKQPKLRGIVVCRENVPIGYIPKSYFYEKIGSKYGYDLYYKKPCTFVCKYEPLIVKHSTPIVNVSTAAMDRSDVDMFDDIIIIKKGQFAGIVDIRTLLLNLVESQVQFASYLNPLSKLPGNEIINQKLQDAINIGEQAVLYFDLDLFKPYNDYYGFKQGDNLLLFLIDVLKTQVSLDEHFLGHIGGDDFIAIIPTNQVTIVCKAIIAAFDHQVVRYYDSQDLKNPPIVTGRNGIQIPLPICSLSIAVVQIDAPKLKVSVEDLSNVAAKVKKKCKAIQGSCYVIEDIHTYFLQYIKKTSSSM